MDVLQTDKLWLLIVFVVPGFISLKVYEALSLRVRREASQQIVDAITYSCINYAILFLPLSLIEKSDLSTTHPTWYFMAYAVAILVMPVAWALAYRKLRAHRWLLNWLPHPTDKPWDYFFAQRAACWAVVTLKDGTRYGGWFGPRSFATNSPNPEQIYLEKCWVVSEGGGLVRERRDTLGVLIVSPDIKSIEFFCDRQPEVNNVESQAEPSSRTPGEGMAAQSKLAAPKPEWRLPTHYKPGTTSTYSRTSPERPLS